ncbi:MAG: hypothetical protein MUP98_05545 [Candidatus Aminicenantes bacterium]|nr:hypothetical protein [Candidatus Aminicenantes bacterium]
MSRKRFTADQIIGILWEADVLGSLGIQSRNLVASWSSSFNFRTACFFAF